MNSLSRLSHRRAERSKADQGNFLTLRSVSPIDSNVAFRACEACFLIQFGALRNGVNQLSLIQRFLLCLKHQNKFPSELADRESVKKSTTPAQLNCAPIHTKSQLFFWVWVDIPHG